MYAGLVGEPFCLPMDRIARLTDRQIREIYGHKRDEKGGIEQPERASPLEPKSREEEKALFFAVCRQLAVPDEQARAEWLAKRGPD